MILTNTIAAPATVPGTGAISIIRVSGEDALSIADKVVSFKHGTASESAGYTLKYGSVEGIDDVLVSIFRAPHSYTGEDSVEISCHASAYIVSQILQRLMDAGAVPAEPGEFTRRAFVNGRMDLAQAEAVADVIASGNEASHRVAMHQLKGGISAELQLLREQLLDVTSLMELELDFSEEDVEFADRHRLDNLLASTLAHIDRLTSSFRLGNAIRTGVPVAIVGATNTGKSTLLNALLGEERAIVSDIAGTTRDTVEEVFNIDGTDFRLIDTAGIRDTFDEIESKGIDRTYQKLLLADVVVHVLDVNSPVGTVSSAVSNIVSKMDLAHQKYIVVLNKADKAVSALELAKIEASEGTFEGSLEVNKIVTIINNIVNLPDYQQDIIVMSAKYSLAVDRLKILLSETQKARIADSGTAALVTNARHYNALCSASRALTLARSGLASHTPTDLVSQDLREALYHLGTITGAITTDEVLGNIFKKFCIGK